MLVVCVVVGLVGLRLLGASIPFIYSDAKASPEGVLLNLSLLAHCADGSVLSATATGGRESLKLPVGKMVSSLGVACSFLTASGKEPMLSLNLAYQIIARTASKVMVVASKNIYVPIVANLGLHQSEVFSIPQGYLTGDAVGVEVSAKADVLTEKSGRTYTSTGSMEIPLKPMLPILAVLPLQSLAPTLRWSKDELLVMATVAVADLGTGSKVYLIASSNLVSAVHVTGCALGGGKTIPTTLVALPTILTPSPLPILQQTNSPSSLSLPPTADWNPSTFTIVPSSWILTTEVRTTPGGGGTGTVTHYVSWFMSTETMTGTIAYSYVSATATVTHWSISGPISLGPVLTRITVTETLGLTTMTTETLTQTMPFKYYSYSSYTGASTGTQTNIKPPPSEPPSEPPSTSNDIVSITPKTEENIVIKVQSDSTTIPDVEVPRYAGGVNIATNEAEFRKLLEEGTPMDQLIGLPRLKIEQLSFLLRVKFSLLGTADLMLLPIPFLGTTVDATIVLVIVALLALLTITSLNHKRKKKRAKRAKHGS